MDKWKLYCQKIISQVTPFIKLVLSKYYLLFLILLVLISYGQILNMYVWEDDNALFFKLAHIEGSAGYLGAGPFGMGVYKYTATPFIPIYHFFGYNTLAYFALALLFYILSTISVYKVFSKIIGKVGGRVAGFLFASGYIASEGIIRLYNTIASSDSIILISLFLLFYWLFFKKRSVYYYLLSLACFFLVTELAMSRSHYLVSVVISFELIFLAFSKPIKSLLLSFLRIIPFGYIFYRYFILGADSRTGQIGNLLQAFSRGEFYQSYSFLASWANLVVPDWVSAFHPSLARWPLLFLSVLTVIVLLRQKKHWKPLTLASVLLLFLWLPVSKIIFTTPVLNLGIRQLFIVFAGGITLIMGGVIGFCLKSERRKLFFFFFLWAILNIAAYGAYNPTFGYVASNRYLAHSFFALVGIFGLLFEELHKRKPQWILASFIIFWGIGNLIYGAAYQHDILQNRSNPARKFYGELQSFVTKAKRGDIFYFDVANSSQGYFRDAIAVAQMPETTALAWRYGLDRYDISLLKDFGSLKEVIQDKKTNLDQVHSFFYSADGLVDTSPQMRDFIKQGSPAEPIKIQSAVVTQSEVKPGQKGTFISENDFNFELPKKINSIYPVNLNLGIKATILDTSNIKFPVIGKGQPSATDIDPNLRNLAFEYQKYKQSIRKTAEFKVSSEWQNRLASNLFDGDLATIWQADRVKWRGHNENILIDLKDIQTIDRLVWVNGFTNQTPTEMSVEVSSDGLSWQRAKEISNTNRIDTKDLQIISFIAVPLRFIRLSFTKTLDGDSPAIAEIWPVPSKFSKLNIKEAEGLQENPFRYIEDQQVFDDTLSNLDYASEISVLWKNDVGGDWHGDLSDNIKIKFDGNLHQYQIVLPAGGTKITKLRLTNIRFPGSLSLENLSISRSALVKP